MNIARRPYAKPSVVTRAPCSVPDCDRYEELTRGRSNGGKCSGHRRREQLGLPLGPLRVWTRGRTRKRRLLLELVLRFVDAEGEIDQLHAWEELLRGFRRVFGTSTVNVRRNGHIARLRRYVFQVADAEGDEDFERAWESMLRGFRRVFRWNRKAGR
ncbi:MAG: hypothetical protein DI536_04180 [Archangium gephyra]|uniref:Uncharacterized protein n=1 Tax=Archangium gephyra TaxID=48 RepID=A0A2W5V7V1_9BACT|nr:MAG: hypothetical protein DI536_04180 [Archangium gephyra]